MRKIDKALVAVSVVAAMCLVPVFAIADDSEAAATLTTGESGASFEIDSIDDDKFNGFVTDDFKEHIMITFIGRLIGSAYFFTTEDLSITNVKEMKLSAGTKVTDEDVTVVYARVITCDISFKATYAGITPVSLFELYDGTQGLYDYIGSNTLSNGDSITFNGGTFKMELSGTKVNKIALDDAKDYVTTELNVKASESFSYSGEVKINNGTVKIFNVDMEKSLSDESTYSFDYFDTDVKDVTAASKVRMTTDSTGAAETLFKYDIKDKGSGSYKYTDVPNSGKPDAYLTSTVGDLDTVLNDRGLDYLYTGTVSAPVYSFYNNAGTHSFFDEDDVKADYRSNDSTKAFLDEVGTTGTSFSEAESITDSVYSKVNVPGSGSGSNVIFYVIIGVLAVAVVLLAAMMFLKKS